MAGARRLVALELAFRSERWKSADEASAFVEASEQEVAEIDAPDLVGDGFEADIFFFEDLLRRLSRHFSIEFRRCG